MDNDKQIVPFEQNVNEPIPVPSEKSLDVPILFGTGLTLQEEHEARIRYNSEKAQQKMSLTYQKKQKKAQQKAAPSAQITEPEMCFYEKNKVVLEFLLQEPTKKEERKKKTDKSKPINIIAEKKSLQKEKKAMEKKAAFCKAMRDHDLLFGRNTKYWEKKAMEENIVEKKAVENEKKAMEKKPVEKKHLKIKRNLRKNDNEENNVNAGEKPIKTAEIVLRQLKKRKVEAVVEDQPHIDEQADDDENPPKKKKYWRNPNFITIRTSPAPLYKVIQNMNEEQKQAIKEIGFGGLLKLRLTENSPEIMTYLIHRFDSCRCAVKLEKEEMVIEEEDVVSVFDLPTGGKQINEISEKDDKAILQKWRKRWNVKDSPLTSKMTEDLCEREDCGDDFKQEFVVFVVTTMFKSHHNRTVNPKILKSVQDVAEIKNFDWCNYMIDRLVESTEEFRRSNTKKRVYTGPAAFLVLCYLDRMIFKLRKPNSRSFPVCSNWTAADVHTRVREERDLNGLGQGKVVERLKKTGMEEEVQQDENVGDQMVKKDLEKKLAKSLSKMTEDVIEFRAIIDEIGKGSTMMQTIKKSFQHMISNDEESTPSQKEESPNDDADERSQKTTPEKMTHPQKSSIPPKPDTEEDKWDDAFFNQPSIQKLLCNLIDAFSLPKKELKTKRKKKERISSQPNFSLGISQLHSTDEDDSVEEDQQPTMHMSTVDDTEIVDSQGVINLSADTEKANDEEIALTPIAENDFKSIFEESENEMDDVLNRRNPERKFKELPLILRSPYWVGNQKRLDKLVSMKEKCISEYAFSETDKRKMSEVLFEGLGLKATRSDFHTMSTDEWIIQNVLDIWSIKLSIENLRRAIGEPKRVFFSTLLYAQMLLDQKKEEEEEKSFNNMIENELKHIGNLNIEDVDLVFFPILQDHHYFAVCINFITKSVEVIDNRKLPQYTSISSNYDDAPMLIAKAFFEYLEFYNMKKEDKLSKWKATMLKMSWRTPNNYVDCGVYCMRHLETYKGNVEKWDAGFNRINDKLTLNALRAKYCSAIIMMDQNTVRQQVLKDARHTLRMKIQ